MDLGLAGRACIITGASRGIGRSTATMLAAEGASLLLVGRREQALVSVVRECERAGGRATALVLDITAPDAGEQAMEACLLEFERLDVLVNNAGAADVRSIDQLTDEEWQTQWDLHVMAPMRLMRAIAPVMAQRGWGRIVNVCSSSGKRPSQWNIAYSASKAAELSLSRAFADAYASQAVLVNAVAPGPVAGDLWLAPGGLADQTAAARESTRERVLEQTAGGTALGRLANEEEIAAAIVFLCSEAASYVTGSAWSADGGAVRIII